jgi:hypothetical protein
MTWLYENEIFTEEKIGSYVGFIYMITEKDTGKKYIGQKVFWNKVAKKPLKGKVNRRISKKPSDWMQYHGSNDILKELVASRGPEMYNREILRLCKTKSELNYYEAKTIFEHDALLRDDYFNQWISTRINKSQLGHLQIEI